MSATAAPTATRALAIGSANYLAATLFWGMNIPLTAILLQTFDPFLLSPLRMALAVLTLAVIIAMREGLSRLWVPARPRQLLVCGALFAGFMLCYNLGLLYTDTITAAALMAGTPVYAAITLRIATGARLERGFALAAALTVVGAAIALLGKADPMMPRRHGGELFILASFACWNLYTLAAQRGFAPDVSTLRRTLASQVVALVFLALAWAVMRAAQFVPPPTMNPDAEAILWLIATGVFATGLGVLFWNIGVGHLGLATGSLWQNMVPVFGVLTAMLFGIKPTLAQVAGGAIVMIGVLSMQAQRLAAARRLGGQVS